MAPWWAGFVAVVCLSVLEGWCCEGLIDGRLIVWTGVDVNRAEILVLVAGTPFGIIEWMKPGVEILNG